jgi:hypothetical protein
MVEAVAADEWAIIEQLLPAGWEEAARRCGAFQRARYIKEPGRLLRTLLFHAVTETGLRETAAQLRASGIAELSQVALLKRLRTSGEWLAWLGQELCREWRDHPALPAALRLRAVDSTTVQGPASKDTQWRVHYTLNLRTLSCDWHALTDRHGGERLDRVPVRAGDVLLGDRNFLQPAGIRAVTAAGGQVLIRLRWNHSAMRDGRGRRFHALERARALRVGKVGEWAVELTAGAAPPVAGRVIAIRLPAPLAARAERRVRRRVSKLGYTRADPRSLRAAHFVMVFTTVPRELLGAAAVLDLYRYRWQIEVAFKRLKQLLKLGRLPHQEPRAARSWILAKLVVALLLEKLYRHARLFSPWGYRLARRPARAH